MVGNAWENSLNAPNMSKSIPNCLKMSQDVPKCPKMSTSDASLSKWRKMAKMITFRTNLLFYFLFLHECILLLFHPMKKKN